MDGIHLGGFNLHIELEFADGVVWLGRFRLMDESRPCIERMNFDRMSEVATYRLLAQTSIPTPAVYDFAHDGDTNNAIGAGYNLFQKLTGHPMDWSKTTEVQKCHVFRQMHDIYFELESGVNRTPSHTRQ